MGGEEAWAYHLEGGGGGENTPSGLVLHHAIRFYHLFFSCFGLRFDLSTCPIALGRRVTINFELFFFLGPLLPDALDVAIIPFRQRQELTINLCGKDLCVE